MQLTALWEWPTSWPCLLADRKSASPPRDQFPHSFLSLLTQPCFVFEDRDLRQEVCVHQPRRSGPHSAQCSTWKEAGSHPSSSWHVAMVTFQEQDVATIAGCRSGLPCPSALAPWAPHIWMVVAVNLLCYAITLPSRDV